jgi:hypothetical protein
MAAQRRRKIYGSGSGYKLWVTGNIGNLGKLRQPLMPKARHTHGNTPHRRADFYPLLAEVGKGPGVAKGEESATKRSIARPTGFLMQSTIPYSPDARVMLIWHRMTMPLMHGFCGARPSLPRQISRVWTLSWTASPPSFLSASGSLSSYLPSYF